MHSPDYLQDASLVVDDNVVLTATIDILRAIADGTGPNNCLLALGYAGWGRDNWIPKSRATVGSALMRMRNLCSAAISMKSGNAR